jgi:hypothetical protein
LPAYKDIFGKGTKVRRARAIARILEDHAQLPDEGVGKFTKDIWRIVEAAIEGVCVPSEDPEKTRRSKGSLLDADRGAQFNAD